MTQQGRSTVEDNQIEVSARNLSTEPVGESSDQCGSVVGSSHQRVVYENCQVEIAVAAIASACSTPKEERDPDPSHRRQRMRQSFLDGIEAGGFHNDNLPC